MRRLTIMMLLAMGAPVFAQAPTGSHRVSWVAPTQLVDNTTIPSTAVLTYNVYAKLGGAAEVKLKSAMTGTSFTQSGPAGQNNCFTVTAMVNGGAESARSVEACAAIMAPTAKPVTTIVIQ